MDAQRALLDSLMGKGRNRTNDDAPLREQHWNDDNVCPFYVCSFCPNDLFVNTKSDLGPCPWIHIDEVRKEYQKESRRVQRRVEKKLLRYLYELVSDVDRRIRRGKERIALNAPSTQPNPILQQQMEQQKKNITVRISQLDDEVNKLKEHISMLCESGNSKKLDDAASILKQVENLESEKSKLVQQIEAIEVIIQKNNENGNGNENENENGNGNHNHHHHHHHRRRHHSRDDAHASSDASGLQTHTNTGSNEGEAESASKSAVSASASDAPAAAADAADATASRSEKLDNGSSGGKQTSMHSNVNADITAGFLYMNGFNKKKLHDKNRFQICEVCGVFQAIDDAQDRIARHFDGKQHKGYAIIRETIKEMEDRHEQERRELSTNGSSEEFEHSSDRRRRRRRLESADRHHSSRYSSSSSHRHRDRDRDRHRDSKYETRHHESSRSRHKRRRSRSRSRSASR